MKTLFAAILLQAEGGAAPQSPIGFLLPMALIFVIFYFLLIRPQTKRQKEHEEMLKRVEKGDRVVTSGGLHGVVTGSTDDVLTVEIGAGAGQPLRVKVDRARIDRRGGQGQRRGRVSGSRWRVAGVVASLLLFGWYTLANFIPASVRKESLWLPDKGIRLGLDLQGGIHWVLGPDLGGRHRARTRRAARLAPGVAHREEGHADAHRSRERAAPHRSRAPRGHGDDPRSGARIQGPRGRDPGWQPARLQAHEQVGTRDSPPQHRADAGSRAPPRRRPDPGHPGIRRDAPGRRPRARADPGRSARSRAGAQSAPEDRLPRIQDRARGGAQRRGASQAARSGTAARDRDRLREGEGQRARAGRLPGREGAESDGRVPDRRAFGDGPALRLGRQLHLQLRRRDQVRQAHRRQRRQATRDPARRSGLLGAEPADAHRWRARLHPRSLRRAECGAISR